MVVVRRLGKHCAGLAVLAALYVPAFAQDSPIRIPRLQDPLHRHEKPQIEALRSIRFLTEAGAPPFSFVGADGRLTGFNVELARALCVELGVSCTIQPMRYDLIGPALVDGKADAIIASLAITSESRKAYGFTRPYLGRPARFAVLKRSDIAGATPAAMSGRKVGVAEGTAHEAFLRAFFPDAVITVFEKAFEARSALRGGRLDAIFDDGVNLTLWLNGESSEGCCAFRGGPFIDARYFGEGMAIAVTKGNERLRKALDFAMTRINEKRIYDEIYLRHFPLGVY